MRAWDKSYPMDFLSDMLKADTPYPPVAPPLKKGWFTIPFENDHGAYLAQFHRDTAPKEMVEKFFNENRIFESAHFRIGNCVVE